MLQHWYKHCKTFDDIRKLSETWDNSGGSTMKRFLYLAIIPILIFGLDACGGKSGGPSDPVGSTSSSDSGSGAPSNINAPLEGAGQEEGGNFLNNFPLNQVVSGGPGKDGIPALTDPLFVEPSEVSYLQDEDLVLGVVINGEARAYPHNIGWWNEIVNDVVGGQPVIVSFCPLTGTGLVFNGEGNNGSRITCGVSGLLFNNNLIMYDRRDDTTLYPQMIFKGVEGPRKGESLALLPVIETTWRYWKQLYPEAKVVSGDNQYYSSNSYLSYPYGTYRESNSAPMFPSLPRLNINPAGPLFPPKQITLGIRFGTIAKAYPFSALGEEAVINDDVAGNPIVVAFYAKEKLALPYSRIVDSQTLTFEKTASLDPVFPFMLKDRETDSTWNLLGEAVEGTRKGQKLAQVPAHNAFWFAWATFWQNTSIFQ